MRAGEKLKTKETGYRAAHVAAHIDVGTQVIDDVVDIEIALGSCDTAL